MFNNLFREPGTRIPNRKEQINTLKIFNDNVSEIVEDVEYQILFDCGGREMCLVIKLGPDFPHEKPALKIKPAVHHQWVTHSGDILSAPGLLNFTVHSDLGRVVQAIIRELVLRPPPLFDDTVPNPNQQVGEINNVPTCGSTNYSYSIPPATTLSYQDFQYSTNNATAAARHSLSASFPELNSLSLSELQDLNVSSVRLDELINILPTKQALSKTINELIDTIENLASDNLKREAELRKLKKEVIENIDILNNAKAEYEGFNLEYQKLCEKFNPHRIRESLRQSVLQIDEESEQLAERFLDGAVDLEKFLSGYINYRMISHSRKAKDEKLSQQLEELERAGY